MVKWEKSNSFANRSKIEIDLPYCMDWKLISFHLPVEFFLLFFIVIPLFVFIDLGTHPMAVFGVDNMLASD